MEIKITLAVRRLFLLTGLSIGSLFPISSNGQTTICSSGCPANLSIPDGGCPTYETYTINVSGVGTIDATFGLTQVCVYLTHTYRGDIDMFLVAPDGTRIELSTDNGSSGNDFGAGCSTGQMLCFDMNATTSITSWSSTDTSLGVYQPEQCIGLVNNGQNADGTWTLEVCDDAGGDVGALEGWCLVFDNNPTVLTVATPDFVVNTFPFTQTGSTCGAGDDISDGNNSCSSLYDRGEDYLYEIQITTPGTYSITAINTDSTGYIGWFLSDQQPTLCGTIEFPACIASATSGLGDTATACVTLDTGTYYLLLDYYPLPTCSNFELIIDQVSNPTPNYNCTNANDNFPDCRCITPGTADLNGSTDTTLYSADKPGNLNSEFCGSIENNQWFCFNAPSSTVTFDFISVTGCTDTNGIQAEVYEVTQCGNSVIFKSVSNCWNPGTEATGTVTATGLVPGQIYVLMVDGFAGDQCNFTIANWEPGVLPLEAIFLVGKVAESGEHILKWTTILTTQEEDVRGTFVIERYSPEIGKMIPIAELPITKQDSFQYVVYPETGTAVATYRILAIQPDNEPVYSNTITLKGTYDGISADITFSPLSKELVIYAWQPALLNIGIYSISGKLVKSWTRDVGKEQTHTISLSQLPPGSYFVQIYDQISGGRRTIPITLY